MSSQLCPWLSTTRFYAREESALRLCATSTPLLLLAHFRLVMSVSYHEFHQIPNRSKPMAGVWNVFNVSVGKEGFGISNFETPLSSIRRLLDRLLLAIWLDPPDERAANRFP